MIISEKKNKNCAVIPFYNEKPTLKKIIETTLPLIDFLILVNDGSTDSWQQEIPQNQKIIVISNEKNLGKGSALKIGILKSIELETNITLTLDADLQHDPSLIPNFIERINSFDCVIGKRELQNTKMPTHRKLSNYLTSKLLSIKTGKQILDSQSGYRAFKTKILIDVLPTFTGFEAESEMIVKLCRKNYSIGYVNIPTIYGKDDSKMKAIQTILGFMKVLFKS